MFTLRPLVQRGRTRRAHRVRSATRTSSRSPRRIPGLSKENEFSNRISQFSDTVDFHRSILEISSRVPLPHSTFIDSMKDVNDVNI